MLYRIQKSYKTLRAAGYNPVNWLFELNAKIIQRRISAAKPKPNLHNGLTALISQKADPAQFTVQANPGANDQGNLRSKISNALSTYGICIISNLLQQQNAKAAGEDILSFLDSERCHALRASAGSEWADEGEFIWQIDHAWTDNYLKLANAGRPIINMRSRATNADDAGMIDLFGVEQLAEQLSLTDLQNLLTSPELEQLSTAVTEISAYPERQANLYVNRGIAKTRGPHLDNNSDPFKIFVYLSDVLDLETGPYCYVPGSQIGRGWMSYERLKNATHGLPSTEVSSFPRNAVTPILGKAGTVIITNQSGIHCGWPQNAEAERALLVKNFY